MSKQQISQHKWNRASQHPDAINVLAYYSMPKDSDCGLVYEAKYAIDAFKLNNFLYVFMANPEGLEYYARYDVSEGAVRHDFVGYCPLQLRNPF